MITPEGYSQLPTYFAPGAFEVVRQNHDSIFYDLDQLAVIDDMAGTMLKRHLPAAPENLAFVYRFAVPGHRQPDADRPFEKANPSANYVSADYLTLQPNVSHDFVTKADITNRHEHLVHVQVQNLERPMAWWLADSLAYPQAEDHKMKASIGAWFQQAKDASPFKEIAKKRFRDRVLSQHAGAILLSPRRTGRVSPII